MAIFQGRAKKKASGGRYKYFRSKKDFETGRTPTLTQIGNTSRKIIRVMGGNKKQKLLLVENANLLDPKTKKFVQAKIKSVIENPANRHYTRRNIITKGAIIETDKGKAKVTSRPGQDGIVNAVLIE